jgi:hypothetical protein
MFPGPEQDRPDSQMQRVDQSAAEVLPNRRDAAANADVAAPGGSPRLIQRGVNAFGDEPKFRASGHWQGRPRVMGQYKHGCVVRRLVAPPAFPALIRPGTPDRSEHVSSENPCADIGEGELGHFVVDAGLAVRVSVHPPPDARVEERLHQIGAVDAERILEILIRPGSVAVD